MTRWPDGAAGGGVMSLLPLLRGRLARAGAVVLAGAALLAAPASTAAASSSHARTAPHWKWSHPYTLPGHVDSVNGMACPTMQLCVAVSARKVLWTTQPTGGRSHWHSATLVTSTQTGAILDDVTCPTASFCVAADDLGNVFVTTHPTGGKSKWHEYAVDSIEILSINCASAKLCAALDYYGNALTTTNPAGAWHSVNITSTTGASYYSVDCSSKHLCAAVEDDGKVAYTTNPGSATPKWRHARVGGPGWKSVSCPTDHKCVAVGGDTNGAIAVSTNPAGGSNTWHRTSVHPAGLGLGKVDCPAAGFCMAVASEDWFSYSPAATASHWHRKTVASGSQTAVSCPNTKHCFVGTSTTQFIRGAKA